MLIKNKTNMFQVCEGVKVRPWRDVVVPDDTNVDLDKFDVIVKGEFKAESKPIHKKNKGE